MKTTPTKAGTFSALTQSIHQVHHDLATQVGKAVNIGLTLRNWLIGYYIEEYERNGADRADYGDRLMDILAKNLTDQGISRCDRRELYRYRQFYLIYPQIVESLTPQFKNALKTQNSEMKQSAVKDQIVELPTPLFTLDGSILISKLSFTHLAELIAIDDSNKRAFYEDECIRGNWSVRELKRQVSSLYYERSGLSRDKKKLAELVQQSARKHSQRSTFAIPTFSSSLG